MLYFKLLSFLLGFALLASGGMFYWRPERAMSFVLTRLWPEEKPTLLKMIAVVLAILTVFCWINSLFYLNAYGLVLTGFLTLFCIKMAVVLPVYTAFRKAVAMLVTTEHVSLLMVMISTLAFGAGFIILGTLIGK